jgi:small GTP-binding protein
MIISKKVILTGSFGVGKTSLFNKFLFEMFSDKYLTTIGVKVNKKSVQVGNDEVSILLWDIAGEISQDKVPTSYFLGASGVIYVADLTRPSTFANLTQDIKYLKGILPNAIIETVGNKLDLVEKSKINELESTFNIHLDHYTSAKNGDNVEALFHTIASKLIANHV